MIGGEIILRELESLWSDRLILEDWGMHALQVTVLKKWVIGLTLVQVSTIWLYLVWALSILKLSLCYLQIHLPLCLQLPLLCSFLHQSLRFLFSLEHFGIGKGDRLVDKDWVYIDLGEVVIAYYRKLGLMLCVQVVYLNNYVVIGWSIWLCARTLRLHCHIFRRPWLRNTLSDGLALFPLVMYVLIISRRLCPLCLFLIAILPYRLLWLMRSKASRCKGFVSIKLLIQRINFIFVVYKLLDLLLRVLSGHALACNNLFAQVLRLRPLSLKL